MVFACDVCHKFKSFDIWIDNYSISFCSIVLSTQKLFCYCRIFFGTEQENNFHFDERAIETSKSEWIEITLVLNKTAAEMSIWFHIFHFKNLQTLYVWSSILVSISYAIFVAYGFLWSKQPGFEFMPAICVGAVFFCGTLGVQSLPYIITTELLPTKVFEIVIFFIFDVSNYIHLFITKPF